MNSSIREIVLAFIDEALDIDDLENIGDYVHSVLQVEGTSDWEMAGALKSLHADITQTASMEEDKVRERKLKAALSCLEADFSDYLLAREIETFARPQREKSQY